MGLKKMREKIELGKITAFFVKKLEIEQPLLAVSEVSVSPPVGARCATCGPTCRINSYRRTVKAGWEW